MQFTTKHYWVMNEVASQIRENPAGARLAIVGDKLIGTGFYGEAAEIIALQDPWLKEAMTVFRDELFNHASYFANDPKSVPPIESLLPGMNDGEVLAAQIINQFKDGMRAAAQSAPISQAPNTTARKITHGPLRAWADKVATRRGSPHS